MATPEEKKLEKLNSLFELVNQDFATPDDLVKLSELLLSIFLKEKDRVQSLIGETDGKIDAKSQEQKRGLLELENSISTAIEQLQSQFSGDIDTVKSQIDTAIKAVEKKIPTKTDLTDLYNRIEAIDNGLNDLPTEFTINNEAIRDGLELLQGNERLDKSAIKGLDEYDELVRLARTPKEIVGAGVKLIRYLSDVNIEGITNGQTIVWSTALQRFEAGSAGSGGGHTIQDEGTPLTQRTNLNFVGLGVTVTDNAGADSTDVTITSGGGSGDVVGPASAVNNNFAAFDTTTGKLIKDSGVSAASFASALGADDNYVTDAEKAALHAAVTVTDSTSIDLTLTGQDITAQRAALTGDISAPQDSNTTTLATVNSNVGAFTNANITVNAKGLITAASNGTGGGNTFNTIYIDQSGGTSDTYGVLSGTINGSNAIFTVSQSAYATGTLKVWLNGQLLTQGSAEDWTETTPASGTFTFVTAPASGSLITVSYQRQTTNGGTLQYARQIVNTSVSATVGSTANTDYVYFITGAHTMSLPAASGNTNLYTFKNNHSANVTIDTVGAETIDGTASISVAPEEAVDIISNGTNYYIT